MTDISTNYFIGQSLGTEKVFDHRLEYNNIPSNALFYLRNATTGKNGARVFHCSRWSAKMAMSN